MQQLHNTGAGPVTNSHDLIQMAGWTPDRNVDVAAELRELDEAGFAVTRFVPRFLAGYSGLTIGSQDATRALVIDGHKAARCADPEWCTAYAQAIGMPVTPVGEYSHMTLVIDETGRFWGGFDQSYGLLGSDLVDVVHGLLVEPGSLHLDREVPE
ncbi:SUKH-3 domain-containing protein [Amycolatopsis rhabdoformis]|uniref:SUKH-3 domain-containing protein n=1 Tax=Amycolatopsis rhabdoformis TaxID=1448059 RepID=A0ABZ1IIG7_9PSEU|nr:SUKH-3 domain-containing protein [Amycolatopsis rhabdoformis]WSE34042.1 SUKH-3 domain-containing protein [Amycolatopsis rhabdoformis]